ncbi:MAG: DUF5916 domain-containing protein, partial [Bacteroidota bacterium]
MKKQQQIRPWLGAWILGLMMATPGSAQEAPRDREVPTRTYTTRYVGDAPPSVDGRLDDAAWTQVPWSGDYIEWSPEENTPPTEQTKLKIVYDMNNLYVAFRCYDRDPAGIVRRLSRRDVFDGDWVEINIDSNRDLRTAFSFTITAAGVQGEEFITDNGNVWDPTWNPIWYAKTQVDEEGWTAEIRIPFSQLRFGDAPAQVWGIQSTRRYFRNEERSLWQRTPLDAPGWVSEFGELHGLTNLRPQRHWEVQPYTVSSLDRYAAEPGNPFRDGRDAQLGVGLDAKIGLTSDLMLDLTINPDFGQVEADPSAIALDGFQIFFPEQRPFFIESKDIFDYKFSASQAANTFGFDNLFYSRRIGRAPQGYPAAPVGAFVQQPDLTTILGAAKFSGKTADGWSIGVLNSTTAAEEARIDTPDGRLTERVEPLTNYVVGRVQKDLNNRNTFVGGLVTATHRQLTEGLGFLHEAAYTGGVDAKHQWKNRTWYLGGNVVWSHVQGSPEAITATQRAQRRLFQRVDAQHVAVDTARTSLTGLGGHVQVGKAAGRWRFESGVTWRSPELELNDVGFQLRADDLRPYAWVGYRTIKPLQRVRRYAVNYQHLAAFDFAGALNEVTLNVNGWVNLNSNWWINGGVTYTPVQYSTFALRGGPRLRQAPSVSYRQGVISDSRRALRLTVNHSGAWGAEQAFRTHEVSGTLTYQPTNALQVSVTPTYTYNYDQLQFVANVDVGDAVRYLNATLDQQTVSLPLRIDYILRPNLSLQYWGQPFISRGRYRRFKHITDATARRLDDRYTAYTDDQLALADGVYGLDEDRDGVAEARFGRPDFAFVQWRS